MQMHVVLLIFGLILLAVGVLGGGFEIKELKVPVYGVGLRLISTVVGLFFILLSLGLGSEVTPGNPGLPPHPPPPSAVHFTLSDTLGTGQISEQVAVVVDGESVGTLTVNQNYPNSEVKVTVPTAGQHSYTIESAAVFSTPTGPVQYAGAGQGTIQVEDGKHYSLRGSMSGSTWLVSLVADE